MRKKIAIIGASGFVSSKHISAIHETKNDLVAMLDPYDSIGAIDKYFPITYFFGILKDLKDSYTKINIIKLNLLKVLKICKEYLIKKF